MQKIINVLAIASTVVSATVVGGGIYVYLNRASIIDGVKSKITEAVMGSVTGALPDVVGGSLPGSTGPAVPSTEFDMPKF